MAACKIVKQSKAPSSRSILQKKDPDEYFSKKPCWRFGACDKKYWSIDDNRVRNLFWTELLPFLKNLESQTWGDIFVKNANNNHSIDVNRLNPVAQRRLTELHFEAEAIQSLRINGTHRLYGYIIDSTFNILWYDIDHGDNPTCVCRSKKKHS